MKRSLILMLMLLAVNFSFSQGWYRLFGGDQFDYAHDVVEMEDSSFLITGMSGSFAVGHSEAFLLKLDKNGVYQWSLPYGGVENDAAFALKYIENYGVYILGRTTVENGDFDVWITLVDENGAIQWERTYPGGYLEEAVDAAITQDSGLIIAVHKYGAMLQDQNASLIRLNAQGDTIWVQEMDDPGKNEITNIEPFQDSMFVVTSNHLDTVLNQYYSSIQMWHEDGTLIWSDSVSISPGSSFLNDFYIEGDTLYAIGTWKYSDTSTYDVMRHMRRLSLGSSGELNIGYTASAGNIQGDVVLPVVGTQYKYTSFRFNDPETGLYNNELFLGLSGIYVAPLGVVSSTITDGDDQMFAGYHTLDSGAIFVGYQSLETGGTAIAVAKIGPNWGYPALQGASFVFDLVNAPELLLGSDVSIFPNPSEGVFQVVANKTLVSSYTIVDLSGKEVASGELSQGENSITAAFLTTGLYMMQIFDGETFVGAERIVIH